MREMLRKRRSQVAMSWVERALGGLVAADEAGEELVEPDADAREDAEGDAAAGHLIEEDCAGGGEEEVGSPDAEEWRKLARLCEGDAD